MLHCIGDVDFVAGNFGFVQSTIQNLPRRADKRLAGEVFLVARLLADQHDGRVSRAFTENGLRGVLVKMAGPAMNGFLAQIRKAFFSEKVGAGDAGVAHGLSSVFLKFNEERCGKFPR